MSGGMLGVADWNGRCGLVYLVTDLINVANTLRKSTGDKCTTQQIESEQRRLCPLYLFDRKDWKLLGRVV